MLNIVIMTMKVAKNVTTPFFTLNYFQVLKKKRFVFSSKFNNGGTEKYTQNKTNGSCKMHVFLHISIIFI